MTVPAFGAAALGVFIGYVAWYFIVRFGGEAFTSDGLVAVVGVFVGGTVVKFLGGHGLPARDLWWYPIGLVIGWALFVLFYFINWLLTNKSALPPGAPKHGPFPTLLPPNFKV